MYRRGATPGRGSAAIATAGTYQRQAQSSLPHQQSTRHLADFHATDTDPSSEDPALPYQFSNAKMSSVDSDAMGERLTLQLLSSIPRADPHTPMGMLSWLEVIHFYP